jgi:hypothetical protein
MVLLYLRDGFLFSHLLIFVLLRRGGYGDTVMIRFGLGMPYCISLFFFLYFLLDWRLGSQTRDRFHVDFPP